VKLSGSQHSYFIGEHGDDKIVIIVPVSAEYGPQSKSDNDPSPDCERRTHLPTVTKGKSEECSH
jgi:hypothetical protein